ncbi:hypothetical protein RB195_020083 [Necator americanus]|uniref:CHK kinase-like domain-containing protein n=1 Tax=Necator americanus TaxID=51031 RepID=A0ABR1CH44_NECAM
MNLYTSAGGLFETHVTWEDIEEDMQRELDTAASFGPNKTAKNIGDGRGFMSRIVLIDPDWQQKDKDLPEKFVVKILTQLTLNQFMAEASKEGNFDSSYITEEYMAGLEYQQKRIFYMRKFSESNPVKGYIIMEYKDDIKAVHVYQNVSIEAIKEVLRVKAVLEAKSLKFTEEEKRVFTEKPFSELFAHLFNKSSADGILKQFSQFADGKLMGRAEQLEKILPDLLDFVWADQLADELGMERVLCHGDLWTTNILWKTRGDDVSVVSVIDFQTAHMGCPANDLVRLFSSCLSGKDRREHWKELVEVYYGYLKEEADGMKLPYTLEQLEESYCRFMPLGAFMVVPAIGPLFQLLGKNSDDEESRKATPQANRQKCCVYKMPGVKDRRIQGSDLGTTLQQFTENVRMENSNGNNFTNGEMRAAIDCRQKLAIS